MPTFDDLITPLSMNLNDLAEGSAVTIPPLSIPATTSGDTVRRHCKTFVTCCHCCDLPSHPHVTNDHCYPQSSVSASQCCLSQPLRVAAQVMGSGLRSLKAKRIHDQRPGYIIPLHHRGDIQLPKVLQYCLANTTEIIPWKTW